MYINANNYGDLIPDTKSSNSDLHTFLRWSTKHTRLELQNRSGESAWYAKEFLLINREKQRKMNRAKPDRPVFAIDR